MGSVRALMDRQRRAVEEEMRAHSGSTSSNIRSADGEASSATAGAPAGAGAAGVAKKAPPPQQSGIQNLRVERVEPREQSPVDPNLLFAYFILGSVGAAVAAVLCARFYS